MLLCASCAPSSKVVIYGTNGTEIYNSEYKMLGTISNSGKAKVKLPKNEYVPFLLSHEANSSLYVPFAVNFKHKGHKTENLVSVLGLFSGFGTIPSLTYISTRSSSQYWNDYKYYKNQSTNQDCRFVSFLDNGEEKKYSTNFFLRCNINNNKRNYFNYSKKKVYRLQAYFKRLCKKCFWYIYRRWLLGTKR